MGRPNSRGSQRVGEPSVEVPVARQGVFICVFDYVAWTPQEPRPIGKGGNCLVQLPFPGIGSAGPVEPGRSQTARNFPDVTRGIRIEYPDRG